MVTKIIFKMLLITVIYLAITLSSTSCAEEINLLNTFKLLSFENILKNGTPKAASNELCFQHLQDTLNSLQDLQNGQWAMRMFDSSTKFPESVLMGMSTHLGNFDECINVNANDKFTGKYCLTTIGLNGSSGSLPGLGRRTNPNELRTFRRESRVAGEIPLFSIGSLTLAYCIPSTCNAADFADVVNNLLNGNNINMTVTLTENRCQTSEARDLGTEDWVAVGVLIFIAVLAISSTAYDLIKTSPKSELLCAFSWYSNGKKLLSTKTSGDTLHSLHGIRFLSMCWVVLGHRHQALMYNPLNNLYDIFDFLKSFWRLYLTNSFLSVDSFFLLSGLLVSYVFLRSMSKGNQTFNIPLFYLHRYLRLTPPYAMIILLQATLLRYASTGPLFPETMKVTAEICQKKWWTSILYVNNYVDYVKSQCIGQGWYLAVDMQLFILSPIILYPLWKWPKKWSLSLLSVLMIAGFITAFTVSQVEKMPATNLSSAAMDFMTVQYVPTHTRFTAWLIGIGFGYLFHETKRLNIKLSKVQVLLGWCIGITGLLGSFLGVYPFLNYEMSKNPLITPSGDPPREMSQLEASFYTTFSRPAWALGLGWLAYACVFGYGGPINTFLSWKAFQPLSRVTYCVFLVHMSYQIIRGASQRTPVHFMDLNLIPDAISDIVIASVLGAILSLSVESPVIILEKHLLGGNSKRSQKKPNIEPGDKSLKENSTLVEVKTETPNGFAITAGDNKKNITQNGHLNHAYINEESLEVLEESDNIDDIGNDLSDQEDNKENPDHPSGENHQEENSDSPNNQVTVLVSYEGNRDSDGPSDGVHQEENPGSPNNQVTVLVSYEGNRENQVKTEHSDMPAFYAENVSAEIHAQNTLSSNVSQDGHTPTLPSPFSHNDGYDDQSYHTAHIQHTDNGTLADN